MSTIVSSATEIPDAPAYVLANDRFMSGWGKSPEQNTVILPCSSYNEAECVARYAEYREDMQRVRIVVNRPRLRSGITYSLFSRHDVETWARKGS
jgi:hypothetical protein